MHNNNRRQLILNAAQESALLRKLATETLCDQVLVFAEKISGVIGAGGKLLICGNGGSAADSSHFAAEMIVRLTALRNRQALPAIALSADTAVLTAAGNDYGFEQIFARQVQGLGQIGDILFCLSTSGNSPNLIKAVESAREKNLITMAMLGGDGGRLGRMVDFKLIIPHHSVQRIQEEQIFLIHLLVELVESDLVGE